MACGSREQLGALTGSDLDEHVSVGRIHEVSLGVFAIRLDGRTIYFNLDTDDSPCADKRLAQV
jgi:hypothetical protein